MSRNYDFVQIEQKWQKYWADHQTFRMLNPGDAGFDANKPKFYVLDMFPYPSGAGLHVGHPLGYIATDIVARYRRMTGCNVLHPMGFDAFGLPAEQYAVEHGVHPRVTTERNIDNMRRQLRAFGLSYDWDRELATTDVAYYRWTQWIFLQLFHSYYDEGQHKARPLTDLVGELQRGERLVDEQGRAVQVSQVSGASRHWDELDQRCRSALLDRYRMAYVADVAVNWCPALGTVLANEEVTADGRSERGNHPVFKRPLRQWMLRITAYAERLLSDLEGVDWPEPIKLMQRNWIGRSEGALVDFSLAERADQADGVIRVFTTRPDTLFGATYMVMAPEHPLVERITTDAQRRAVDEYRRNAAAKTELDRQADSKTKTGVFTGAYAVNPVNSESIPIWIADYVLMGYGTGAIMAVPGHDQRDFDFARAFDLPIRPVVLPPDAWIEQQGQASGRPDVADADARRQDYLDHIADYGVAFTAEGKGINSHNADASLDGQHTTQAKRTITTWLQQKGLGCFQVQYKLRDWLFSRQRYWGEPFPILHGLDGDTVGVAEDQLPVELPPMDDFRPPVSDDPNVSPQPTLGRAPKSWRDVEIDGKTYQRELNTMPQWAGSCWYYLRFLDPRNDRQLVDPHVERYWMGPSNDGEGRQMPGGVDLYVGGAEHAVLHLLYARFWHKLLYDLGHVSTPEPFGRLFNQGYILAHYFEDERGVRVPAVDVEQQDGRFIYQGKPVTRQYGKMGKSLKNAVNPDDIFHEYGCDTLRLYEMYMGPLETSKPWNTRDIVGVHRFLHRVWRNVFGAGNDDDGGSADDQPAPPAATGDDRPVRVSDAAADTEIKRLLHKTIKRVTDDMERLRFNTALAALIELNNRLVALDTLPREVIEPFVLMLAPFAPHVAEEIWQALGHEQSLAYVSWPSYDEAYLVVEELEIVVQLKGKTRGRVRVPADAGEQEVRDVALADPKIAKHLAGKPIRKAIYVPGRLINLVW